MAVMLVTGTAVSARTATARPAQAFVRRPARSFAPRLQQSSVFRVVKLQAGEAQAGTTTGIQRGIAITPAAQHADPQFGRY